MTYVIFAQVTVSVLIMLQLTQAVVGQTASTGFLVSLKLKIYLFKLTNIFVQIVKFFFQIVKYICPNCQVYLSHVQNIFQLTSSGRQIDYRLEKVFLADRFLPKELM